MLESDKRSECLQRFDVIRRYLNDNADANELFLPEAIAANKIMPLLQADLPNVDAIVSAINKVDDAPHYNGSGWLELNLELVLYLSSTDHCVSISNGKLVYTTFETP